MKSLGKWGAWILAVVVLVSAAAMADDDPPSRVARLQYMSGAVSLQPGGVNDWVAGVLNRPLTTADRLWTDQDARAELDLGSAAVRAGAQTSMTLTNLTDSTLQVELDQGTLDVRVRRLYDGEIYEIDTPNLAFTIMRAGEYRFDVDPNGGTTVVTVWHGRGVATGDGRSVSVKGDHQARFSGGTSLVHEMRDDPERDGFDDWCRVRDQREEYSQSARYVSPDVIGAEDLDDYGRWHVVPAYGAVWVPAVSPDWAPYHYGHWAWVEPWGWTWVDDEPWGFAPCHYGRWVYYEGAWAWVPGPRVVRPVYAPALVAWVGGGGASVTIAIGEQPTVGWFPLGYGEPYVPPYGGSRNYFQQVNVSNTHITNITQVTNNYYVTNNVNSNNTTINRTTVVNNNTTNITNNTTNVVDNSVHVNGNHNNVHIRYANEKVPGAVTAVPTTVLASSQPVAPAAVHVPAREWKSAPIAVAPPVAPSRNSVLGARAGVPTVAPPVQAMSRQVVMRMPAPPKPVPFAAKQEALEHRPGRPLDHDTEEALRTRIARQQVNRPTRAAEQEPGVGNPGNARPVFTAPQQGAQMPQGERGPAYRAVPRPPVNSQVNADRPVQEHVVPQPPPRGNGAQPGFRPFNAPQNEEHAVPQAPQRSNGAQPGFRPFNAPQSEGHAVPQPPQRSNGTQPGFRPFNAPQSEGHAVPQPPSSRVVNHDEQSGRPAPAQPRYQQDQPSTPRFDRRGNGSTPSNGANGGNSYHAQPVRTQEPAPKAQAQSGGHPEQSHGSNPPHNQESKGGKNTEQNH